MFARLRLITLLLFVTLAASACGTNREHTAAATNDHDASDGVGASDAGPRDAVADASPAATTTCGGPHFDEQSADVGYAQCSGAPGEWYCACDAPDDAAPTPSGEPRSTADTCEAALDDACGLQKAGYTDCDSLLGQCYPVVDATGQYAPGKFGCKCAGDTQLTTVDDAICDDALEHACRKPCDIDGNHCDPEGSPNIYDCTCADGQSLTVGATTCDVAADRACNPAYRCSQNGDSCQPSAGLNQWTCTCDSYYHATRTVQGVITCQKAMDAACNPTGSRCNGRWGFCDKVDGPDYSFTCQCLDGTTMTDTVNIDDCLIDLEIACTPPGQDCSRSGSDYKAFCAKATQQGHDGFVCGCDYDSCSGSPRYDTFYVTDYCEEALAQIVCANPC